MDIKSRIEELLQAGVDLPDVVYSLIEAECNPFDTARAFRRLNYDCIFRSFGDDALLEVSPEPCYTEDEGYKIPLHLEIPWPTRVQIE